MLSITLDGIIFNKSKERVYRSMGIFLDSKVPFEAYKSVVSGRYFVDKSKLLEELFPALGTEERFYCITRPRRFGKSIMASMIGTFFWKCNRC